MTLLQFLRQARRVHHQFISAGPELYRLRPEFVTALWSSTNFPALKNEEKFENTQHSAGDFLREHILTVADFSQSLQDQRVLKQILTEATLVDWNALPCPSRNDKGFGSLTGLAGVSFRALGCIDHHVDEGYMPTADELPRNQPLIIQPGPGSCASLIVRELQRQTLWADNTVEMVQVAKLALSAILIDTSNLTAEGKVTDVDREAVQSLRNQIEAPQEVSTTQYKWDLEGFYGGIVDAKKNSLDLLTVDEVLDRDYKDWTEKSQSSGQNVKIGFCSSVKPIRWIVQKAGTPEEFLKSARSFAASADKDLDVLVVMTAFTAKDGQFCRELFIGVARENEAALEGAKAFVEQTSSQLGLIDWSPLDAEDIPELTGDAFSPLNADSPLWRRLWVQKNAAGSRKQVAPLLRTAVARL
ncbi:unnamed protein product [Penicillium bialowiezense]